MKDTEYYADFDEGTGLYCVFGDETGHAYASYASPEEAEREAKRMNEEAESREADLKARSRRGQGGPAQKRS